MVVTTDEDSNYPRKNKVDYDSGYNVGDPENEERGDSTNARPGEKTDEELKRFSPATWGGRTSLRGEERSSPIERKQLGASSKLIVLKREIRRFTRSFNDSGVKVEKRSPKSGRRIREQ